MLGLSGIITSWTKIHVPPIGFKSHAPYIVVIAEFSNKKRLTSQLVDWEERHLRLGQKVVTVLRKTRDPGLEGVIPYGVKCKPLDS